MPAVLRASSMETDESLEVHDRIPVILPPDAQTAWLNPAVRHRELLEPDADTLELVAVSSLVNSVKNEDPRLIEPLYTARSDQ